MFCNPANGRVDFEDGWLIKSGSKTDQDQSPKKKVMQDPTAYNIIGLVIG